MWKQMARAFSSCPYATLGIAKDASKSQIRKAYISKVMQTHPDRLSALSDSDKLKRKEEFVHVARAYEILSKHKKEYDCGRYHNNYQTNSRRTHSQSSGYSRPSGYRGAKYSEYWARRERYERTGEGENPKIFGPNTLVMMGVLGISSLLGYISYNRRMHVFKQSTR
jgi:curved DNA-binding protein CbpA